MIDENTQIPTHEPLLRSALLTVFGGRCFYSGRELTVETMHVDHVVPKSRGGKDCIANYVPSCAEINLRKSAGEHVEMTAMALETVRALYAPKVVDVFKALLGTGRYPRPRGRPTVAPEHKLETMTIRLTRAQREKFAALGDVEWLRKQIDQAKDGCVTGECKDENNACVTG